jgi:beta-RFAP synthase
MLEGAQQAPKGKSVDGEPSVLTNAVRVRAPARLHLGFLDLHGGLGRRFGSLGVSLDEPALELSIDRADRLSVSGPECERVSAAVRAAAAHLRASDRVRVRVTRTIPSHAGFGSGTQLSLAAAAGLARLFGHRFNPVEAAEALDRGKRSGVGLAAFTGGGFIVDGGRDRTGRAPPVLARHDFPDPWRLLLVLDGGVEGVHGGTETAAFGSMPLFPSDLAAHLCRMTLMQVLPALVLADFELFSRAVGEIQRRVGDYFAPFQGGGRFTSPAVADVMAALAAEGIEGIGQSSWGPTGFALFPSGAGAERTLARLRPTHPGLTFMVARGRNRGAELTDTILEGTR